MTVARAITLANRLLKECRAHLRRQGNVTNIQADPLFSLSYVMAEFIAASSNTEGDIEQAITINSDIIRGRARERLAEMIANRKRRMN